MKSSTVSFACWAKYVALVMILLPGLLVESAASQPEETPSRKCNDMNAVSVDKAEEKQDTLMIDLLASDYNIVGECSATWLEVLAADQGSAYYAAEALRRGCCVEQSGALVKLLRHCQRFVRIRAASLLGSLGDAEAASVLKAMLNDADAEVASTALGSWCVLSPTECRTKLREFALTGASSEFRSAAMDAASRLNYSFSAEDMLSILRDPSTDVFGVMRHLDCSLIAKSAPIRGALLSLARPALRTPTTPTATSNAVSVYEALVRCRPREMLGDLRNLLSDAAMLTKDEGSFGSLIEAVAACGGRAAAPAIEAFVLSRSPDPEEMKPTPTPIVVNMRRAMRVLGEIGSQASLGAIHVGLHDARPSVRFAALQAAERLGLLCSILERLRYMVKMESGAFVRNEALRLLDLSNERCSP